MLELLGIFFIAWIISYTPSRRNSGEQFEEDPENPGKYIKRIDPHEAAKVETITSMIWAALFALALMYGGAVCYYAFLAPLFFH